MSQRIKAFEKTFSAENDLSSLQYTLVKLGSSANEVDSATDNQDTIVGVLENKPEAGEAASVQILGTSKVVASAAISRGDRVTATTGGKAVATTTDGDSVAGIALEAASAEDDIIEILLTPGSLYAASA